MIGLVPLLGLVRWGKTLENATDYSLQNTVRQALFLPTSREAKYKAKAAIDTFFMRFGDVLQAGLVRLGAQFHLAVLRVSPGSTSASPWSGSSPLRDCHGSTGGCVSELRLAVRRQLPTGGEGAPQAGFTRRRRAPHAATDGSPETPAPARAACGPRCGARGTPPSTARPAACTASRLKTCSSDLSARSRSTSSRYQYWLSLRRGCPAASGPPRSRASWTARAPLPPAALIVEPQSSLMRCRNSSARLQLKRISKRGSSSALVSPSTARCELV